jgi:molybdopterin-containing oxidoreductase family iron-sulfur binding subunit
LNLWTGGFDGAGGLSWGRDPLSEVAERLGLAVSAQHDPGALPDMLRPLFEIKRSPVEVLVCVETDLVHELPGQDQIARALSHIPFVASFSTHEDETSKLAHLTLPTLFDLESWDLPAPAWGVPETSLQVQRPALVPVVDARSVEDVILDLASAGVAGAGFSPPADDAKGTVAAAVGALVERGRGDIVESRGRRKLASLKASSAVRALLSGESVWVAPPEPGPGARRSTSTAAGPPTAAPQLAPDQLWLVPFDTPAIQRGRILNRPMMMEMSGMLHGLAWESWLEIHPDDARRRGISNGDRLKIRGPRAEISSRAVVTRGVAPTVVAIPVGFGHEALGSVAVAGTGGNPLALPFAVFDDETGAPAWGPTPVFIVKA